MSCAQVVVASQAALSLALEARATFTQTPTHRHTHGPIRASMARSLRTVH